MTNKFNARKTQVHGLWFDSKLEAMHYLVLKDRLRKGEIAELSMQPKFELVVNDMKIGTYTPDFLYLEYGPPCLGFRTTRLVAEDTKGVRTEAFALRSKLFQALHPHIELRVNSVAVKKLTRPKAA